MGEVVGAGLLAHVPTIMLPPADPAGAQRGQGDHAGPRRCTSSAREVFETLDYDTVVVLDSHWFTTVEFVVTAQDRRAGLFTAEELPRGMCRIPYDWRGDPELALAMADAGDRARHLGDRDRRPVPADVLRHRSTCGSYLGEGLDKRWVSVSVAQTGDTEDFLRAGPGPRRRDRRDRPQGAPASPPARCRTRSGSCASCATTRPATRRTSAPRRRTPPTRERIALVHGRATTPGCSTRWPSSCSYRPEAMFAHYLMMIGALGEGDVPRAGRASTASTRTPIGTGQVHVWFDRPEGGFPGPRRTPTTPTTSARWAAPTSPPRAERKR